MAIDFPNISPIIFEIGPIIIRWYSLAYIFGIVLGLHYISFLIKKLNIPIKSEVFYDAMSWMIIGIVLGGRLGYVLFYDFNYYIHHPIEIIKSWNGGMSFHGGFLGFLLSIYFYSIYKKTLSFFAMTDLIACAAPIGLFLGRIANFINGELYGRVTNVSWGIVFPDAGPDARHPSQIYEAIGEGIILFMITNILIFKTNIRHYPGRLSGCFLIIYSIARIIVENFREADAHVGYLFSYITRGQLLSLPMIFFGIIIIATSSKKL